MVQWWTWWFKAYGWMILMILRDFSSLKDSDSQKEEVLLKFGYISKKCWEVMQTVPGSISSGLRLYHVQVKTIVSSYATYSIEFLCSTLLTFNFL